MTAEQGASSSASTRRVVVSFDIDGTMEFGEPPGPIPVAFVADLVAEGHVVGCASDRGRSSQAPLWEAHGIELHFVGGKHHLPEVRGAYRAERYVHIGDTHVDRHYAGLAQFEFVFVYDLDRPAITDADDHAALRSAILGP